MKKIFTIIFAALFTLPALAATQSEYEKCVSDINAQYNILYNFDEDQDYQRIFNELKQKADEEYKQELDKPTKVHYIGSCNVTNFPAVTYECDIGQTPRECIPEHCWFKYKRDDMSLKKDAQEQFINKKIAEECNNPPTNTSETVSTQSDTPSTAEKTITGQVIDSVTEAPVEFAAVYALGTDKGISADIDGNFSLTVPDSVSQIKISRTGYEEQIFDVPANNNMDKIKLTESQTGLDEVVVAGCTPHEDDNSKSLARDIVGQKCHPITCVSDRYKLTNPRSVQSRKGRQEVCIGSADEDGPCEDFCEDDECETIIVGDACEDQVGKECVSGDANATESEYKWENEQLVCYVTACSGGYELSDGKCVAISGNCNPMPEHATVAHRAWDTTTNTEICIIDACSGEYRPSSDQRSCIRATLTEEESQKKIDELQKNADAMREKEQSTANRLLGGLSIGATGIGGMQLASAVAENRADDAAERDMAAYLATFRCDYGAGRNIAGGETDVQLPGGNTLFQLRQEFATLSTDVKTRKEALGLAPGIESEVVMDSANMGLYDDVSLGRTDGAYTSLSRALSNPTGADAAEWAQQRADTSSQLKTGAITAGIGIVGGVVGDLLINHDAPKEQSDKINAKYEPLKKLRDEIEKLSDNNVGAQCPSDATGTHPNCKCTNTKQIYNGNTNACDTCPGDLVADTSGTNCVCPAGTVPGIANACVIPTNEPECVTTEHTQIADDGTCTCTDGYQKVGNVCLCQSPIYYVNDEGQCVIGTPPETPGVEESINLPADSLFDLNKSELKVEAESALKNFATNVTTAQSGQPSYCITITGHTDKTGNDSINKPLSERRAKAVADYLTAQGIPTANIISSGVGSSQCESNGNQPTCRKVVVTFDATKSCSK